MNLDLVILTAGLFITAYLIVSNRLVALLHPLRIDLAELGAFLLEQSDLPVPYRARIEYSLDRAYSPASAWLIAFATPIATVLAVRDLVLMRQNDGLADIPTELRADMRLFCVLSVTTTVGNSVGASVLFALQIFLSMILWLPVGTVLRELMQTTFNVEQMSARVTSNLGHWRQAA